MQIPAIKHLAFASLLFALSLTFGFPKAAFQKAKKLKIELGRTFLNDTVKIYFDKKLVYHQQLNTPDSAQITDIFEVKKPEKPFTITVEINGIKFEKSSPKRQKELDDEGYSLLIDYNREAEEVEIKTKTVIILYD